MELLQHQSQQQKLSQQQIQSVELLQMSAPELEVYLRELAQENPVVELEEARPEGEGPREAELLGRLSWLEDNDRQNRYYQHMDEEELDPLARVGTAGGLEETLFRFLSRQLYQKDLDEDTAQGVRYLAACLDGDGYLRTPLDRAGGKPGLLPGAGGTVSVHPPLPGTGGGGGGDPVPVPGAPAGAHPRDGPRPGDRPAPPGGPGPAAVQGHRRQAGRIGGGGAPGGAADPGAGAPARGPLRATGAGAVHPARPVRGGGGGGPDRPAAGRGPAPLPDQRLLPEAAAGHRGPGGPGLSDGQAAPGRGGPPGAGTAGEHPAAVRPGHRPAAGGLFSGRGPRGWSPCGCPTWRRSWSSTSPPSAGRCGRNTSSAAGGPIPCTTSSPGAPPPRAARWAARPPGPCCAG